MRLFRMDRPRGDAGWIGRLLTPHDDVPGEPADGWDPREGFIERPERHPPPETGLSLAEDALPVAVLIRVDPVKQEILHE